MDGQSPSAHSVEVLRQEGIDISGVQSNSLQEEIVAAATHIFVMTEGHSRAIEMLFPHAVNKLYLVCEFAPDASASGEVPDPIGLGISAYVETRETFKKALPNVLAFIEQTTKSIP